RQVHGDFLFVLVAKLLELGQRDSDGSIEALIPRFLTLEQFCVLDAAIRLEPDAADRGTFARLQRGDLPAIIDVSGKFLEIGVALAHLGEAVLVALERT